MKNIEFFQVLTFETTKPEVKFWICEVTKQKLFPSHEAEAEALASNASASLKPKQLRTHV